MKKTIKITLIVLGSLFILGLIFGLFSSDGQKNLEEGRQDGKGVAEKSAVDQMTALEQMEVAFIDNPSQKDIKEKLDRALTLYDTEITEENYSRAGSTLVALRKTSKTGVTEMQVLDYMIRSHVEDVNMSFPDAAGISFTALEMNIDGNR